MDLKEFVKLHQDGFKNFIHRENDNGDDQRSDGNNNGAAL